LPARHVQGYHSFAHRDDLPASFYFLEHAEGICIGGITERERCAALYHTRTVIWDGVFFLCNLI
jgi:hypothetical protein